MIKNKLLLSFIGIILLTVFTFGQPIITIDSPIDSFTVIGDSVPLNWNLDTTGDTISSCFFNLDGGAEDLSIFVSPATSLFVDKPNATSFPPNDTNFANPFLDASFIYVNYTKVSGATNNSLWDLKWGFRNDTLPSPTSDCLPIERQNFSIPSSCWDFSNTELAFRYKLMDRAGFPDRLELDCYNGTWEEIAFIIQQNPNGAFGQGSSKFYPDKTFDSDLTTVSAFSEGSVNFEWTRTICTGIANAFGVYEEAIHWDIPVQVQNVTLISLTEGSHDVVVSCNNSIGQIGLDTALFTIFIPLFPNESVGEGELFNILRSSGAGLSTFIQFMSASIPVLLIGLLFVGIILVIGFAIATIIKRATFMEK